MRTEREKRKSKPFLFCLKKSSDAPGGIVDKRTRLQSLVWEDSTCCRATKPVHPDYWVCHLEPGAVTTEAQTPGAHAPQHTVGSSPALWAGESLCTTEKIRHKPRNKSLKTWFETDIMGENVPNLIRKQMQPYGL